MLEKVKTALGITSNYQDNILQIYLDEVIAFLTDAGVSTDILSSDEATGIIVRGVADLWNYGSGGTHLSTYFMQRASQLVSKTYVVNASSTESESEDGNE